MIRVLHVVVNMNRGGAETLLMNVYRKIDRGKIQFDFLTFKEGVFDDEIKELGGILHRIPSIRESFPINFFRNLLRFFKKHSEYSIVHSHMDKMSGFILKAAKKSGIPVRIAHSHSTKSEGNFISRAFKFCVGLLIRNAATHRLACSKESGKWLFARGDVTIVNNGIDLDLFKSDRELRNTVRNELGIDENTLVLGHSGRFSKQKNHKFIVEVFAELLKLNQNSKLLLVGGGDLEDAIRLQTLKYGVSDKVIFMGIVSDVYKYLNAIDVFIFPSLFEGFPVALIEAQAIGLPCIISNRITIDIIFNKDQVTALEIGKPIEWANAINSIKAFSYEDGNAKIIDCGFSIKRTVDIITDFYERIFPR